MGDRWMEVVQNPIQWRILILEVLNLRILPLENQSAVSVLSSICHPHAPSPKILDGLQLKFLLTIYIKSFRGHLLLARRVLYNAYVT